MIISFTVYGKAKPKGSTTSKFVPGRGRTFTRSPTSTKDWQALVSEVAQKHVPDRLFDGPLVVEMSFFLPRPKSRPKRDEYPDRKPDLDKLERAILDGLKSIIYTDDARVIDLVARKRYGDPPRVEISVLPVEDLPF